MNVNGTNYGVTSNSQYNRYTAFTKHSGDETATPGTSDKPSGGVISASNEPDSRACTDIWRMPRGSLTYDKGSAANSKIYTSSGTLTGTSTTKTKYSGQKILDEIDKYVSEGKIYAIFNNGKETWLQGIEPGRNGGPVGSKKYFDPKELEASLGKVSVKSMTTGNNAVLFDNNAYYKFTGKDGKEHKVLSHGGLLHTGLLGNSTYNKEEKDFIDFWNALAGGNSSGVNAKFDREEIRSRLAQAGIEDGFFTVTIGGRTATHFLSQGKNSLAVYSKEQYDARYQAIKDGTMFKRYAGSTVSIGGKEYAVGEDGKVDIDYGADVFDIFAKAQ